MSRAVQQVEHDECKAGQLRLATADAAGTDLNGSPAPDDLNDRFVPFPRAIEWALGELRRHTPPDDAFDRNLSARLHVLGDRFSELVDSADVKGFLALFKSVLEMMRLCDNARRSEMEFVANVVGHVASVEIARIQAEAQSGMFGTERRRPEMADVVSAVTEAALQSLAGTGEAEAASTVDDASEAA